MSNKIMRLPEVTVTTGLKRSSIYEFIKKGVFPAPIPIGEKAVGWLSVEIFDWINQRAAMRRTASIVGTHPNPNQPA